MDDSATTAASDDLKDAAMSGVRWVAAGRVVAEVAAFCSAVVLARLVTPSEFGEATVALIFVPLAAILTFEGFGSALVRKDEIGRRDIESATFASVWLGLALSLLTLALSGPVVGGIFGARVGELVRLVSPVFALSGLGTVSRSILWRRLDFRLISLIDGGSLVVAAATSLGLALAGLDGEAIVLGGVAATVTTTLLLLVAVPPAMPRRHREELADVTRFGLPASFQGLLYIGVSNVDYAILAARLGSAQVGFYWRAFQLGVVYQEKITGIMMRVAFPIYSRTADLEEMTAFHERATRIQAAVIVPLLALLVVMAPTAVPWLFGDQWVPAVEPTQILAVAGMLAGVLAGYAQLLLAAGHPRALLAFNGGLFVVYSTAISIAAPAGITTVAVVVVAVHVAIVAAVYGLLFHRLLGISRRRVVTDFAPALVSGAALLVAAFPAAGVLRDAGVPALEEMAATAGLGLIAYVLVLRAAFPAVLADIVAVVGRVVPARVRIGMPRRRPAVEATTR